MTPKIFIISYGFQYLRLTPTIWDEPSVYTQDIGIPISHNWDIFILYRHFAQLKHTHPIEIVKVCNSMCVYKFYR